MKYSAETYARAFWEAKPEMKKFLSVVRKNGDAHRLGKIVNALETLATHEHGGRMVSIEFARHADQTKVDTLKKRFSSKDHVSMSINPSLIAGARVTMDGEQEMDASFQRKLNKLFI